MLKIKDMEKLGEYLVKVEDACEEQNGEPSYSPVYRCVFAKDALVSELPGIESCWDMFCESVKRNPAKEMLGQQKVEHGKVGGYFWLTYKEVHDIAIQVGSALRSCGVSPGNSCGIYGSNSSEWVIALEACNSQGISCVPLYDTLGTTAVEFIICHAEVSIIFVQESKISLVLNCLSRCSNHLKTLVSFAGIEKNQREQADKLQLSFYSWHEFLLLGTLRMYAPLRPRKIDTCTIMYTSGTTDEPKGVVLTHANIIAEIAAVDKMFRCTGAEITSSDTYLSYLPLAHIFEFSFVQHLIYVGASIGFWRGDVRLLLEDVLQLKPTILVGVPRVFERISAVINAKMSAGGEMIKKFFDAAYNYKLKKMKEGLKPEKAAPLFDKLLFKKINQRLGGNLRFIISGGAPLARVLEEFLRVTSCCSLIQGYGLTETCSGIMSSLNGVFDMIGTVGVPNTGVEVRLRSVPEMGYDALSKQPCGEICIRGKNIFVGYHKREDLTKEALRNGWFYTGDIGELLPNGTFKIIDRKKNILKLSQGEYVAVEKLENIYNQCSVINSIWVHGNSFESFLVAIVVPDPQQLINWANANGESGNVESLCKNKKANDYIRDELNSTASKHDLKGFEKLKAIHLEPKPFDLERGLITPTFKLKRSELLKHYKDVIDGLYKYNK
eukprot:TRINITY_DN6170_c0_g2_i2.p1 TRINITY_DN6170_c0_g2~~TRINITY_DN6170_c0_g2_i2.p1  ORF type:complete len:666 (+),score=118.51 TRINITY_DN6170_c0_g2_i2:100-2097(+)